MWSSALCDQSDNFALKQIRCIMEYWHRWQSKQVVVFVLGDLYMYMHVQIWGTENKHRGLFVASKLNTSTNCYCKWQQLPECSF